MLRNVCDRYDPEPNDYEDMAEFLDMCRECFNELPGLHSPTAGEWHDQEGLVLVEVPDLTIVVGWTTRGAVRGECGHFHRTEQSAKRCLKRDQEGCAEQGGYSDRSVQGVTVQEALELSRVPWALLEAKGVELGGVARLARVRGDSVLQARALAAVKKRENR